MRVVVQLDVRLLNADGSLDLLFDELLDHQALLRLERLLDDVRVVVVPHPLGGVVHQLCGDILTKEFQFLLAIPLVLRTEILGQTLDLGIQLLRGELAAPDLRDHHAPVAFPVTALIERGRARQLPLRVQGTIHPLQALHGAPVDLLIQVGLGIKGLHLQIPGHRVLVIVELVHVDVAHDVVHVRALFVGGRGIPEIPVVFDDGLRVQLPIVEYVGILPLLLRRDGGDGSLGARRECEHCQQDAEDRKEDVHSCLCLGLEGF